MTRVRLIVNWLSYSQMSLDCIGGADLTKVSSDSSS